MRNRFDQFSKQFLEETLAPSGAVALNRAVPGETRYIDVYFIPDPEEPLS